MKLNLQHIILSAAVSAFLVVINPLRSFAQESELVPRQYTEKPSTQEPNDFETESLSEDESVATKNEAGSYIAKDSIVSSTAKSNQAASHRHQRSKANNDVAKQPENQKQVDKAKEEKDSILSFNFIYYIFKKFKWSDIVD